MTDETNDKPKRSKPSGAAGSDPDSVSGGTTERIAKRLARAGVASRRDAEAMIGAGRVSVNGRVLDTPAVNVGSGDRIEIDGAPLPAIERTRLFLFHKPSGVVTTNRDPMGRRTVFDVLPESLPRVITVGRLDLNTEGLLLLTNDGGLARVLELPSTGWLRRYRVRVHGRVDEQALAGLKDGIAVDGVFYGAIEASLDRIQGTNAWLTLGLREGKNREVRNVLKALNLEVTRLIRISYGPFQLADIAEGAVQEIRGRTLRDQLGERLIREAGANFDAPVATPLARDKARRPAREEAEGERPDRRRDGTKAGERPGKRERAARDAADHPRKGARGDRPDRQERRDSALGRLDTRPARGGKGGGKRDERQGYEVPARRTANVWMAPGARPLGERKKAERAAQASEETPRRRSAGSAGTRGGKPAERGEGRFRGPDRARDDDARPKRRFEKDDRPRHPRRDEEGDAAPRSRPRGGERSAEKKFAGPGERTGSAKPGREVPADKPRTRQARPGGDGKGRPQRSGAGHGGRPPRSGSGPRKGPPKGRKS